MLLNEVPMIRFVEIEFEHYLIGLGFSADYVIVEDWNVRKRIVA